MTNDIDLVAAVRERHIKELLAAFPPDQFFISEDAVREAIHLRGQFNIIHPASGIKIDVIIKKDSRFDDSRFARLKRIYPAESYEANFAAPEDVIIKKMEYYRDGGSEKHLRDITGILKISKDRVDRDYISDWAKRLNLTEIWDAIRKRLGEQS